MMNRILKKAAMAVTVFGTMMIAVPFSVYAAGSGNVKIDADHFPDAQIRDAVTIYDFDKDGILSSDEISEIDAIICDENGHNVTSLKGLEYLTDLREFECSKGTFTSLDLSANTQLERIYCAEGNLTAVNVSNNTKLQCLVLSDNKLTSLDISKNTELKGLYCYDNLLTELNLSANTQLESLECSDNELTSLDVSNNTQLKELYCGDNSLTALNLEKCTKLIRLDCSFNQISSLDLNNNPLIYLSCCFNNIATLDISNNPVLKNVYTNGTAELNDEVSLYRISIENDERAQCLEYDSTTTLITDPKQTETQSETQAQTQAQTQAAQAAQTAQESVTVAKKPASVKAKVKKNKVTITWKKIKKTKKTKKLLGTIKSVEIQYSTDPGFKQNVSSKRVGKKKTKVTLKLQRKTTYYVRVRYVGADGVSVWSPVKTVKTK